MRAHLAVTVLENHGKKQDAHASCFYKMRLLSKCGK